VKTLGEIAIEAGLVNKVTAAKAGQMAEARKEPLVVVLVRELGVNEVALVAALRKQTRVPLIDPGSIEIDPEALRQVPRDICARLRLLPLSLSTDRRGKLLRIAMADPTDTQAVAEIEQLTHCDVEVNVLPLSAIDELVAKGYRQINTAVVSRADNPGATMFVTSRGKVVAEAESEVSVTAQIPLATLQAMGPDDLEARFSALVGLLLAKGLVTEAELAEALRKGKP
jgi:Type II secretion system (T2SS), protein E, N-terminal domain